MITEKYEISQNWETHQIIVPHESEQLQYGIDRALLRLKWKNVQEMIRENMEAMQNPTSDQMLQECLQTHMTLKAFEKEIASMLGIIVAK